MAQSVSSWFYEQLYNKNSEPVVKLFIDNSDHSERVLKWPVIKQDTERIYPTSSSVTLVNADGLYNDFYSELIAFNKECQLQFGFTHPESGEEVYNYFTGHVRKVSFSKQTELKIDIFNKFYDLSKVKVGSTSDPASYGNQIPTEIVFSILTDYAGLDSVRSSSNADINWTWFNDWAASFSTDNITAEAHFTGEKVLDALASIANMTDSVIWVARGGKFKFERFTEATSNETLFNEGEYSDLKVSIDGTVVVNRQYISLNYSVASDYWEDQVVSVNTFSVNSYGLQEDIRESENFWFVDSVDALVQADRRLSRFATPPRKFELTLPMFASILSPADSLRFVNSFYSVNSSQSWRIYNKEVSLNPKKFYTKMATNEGFVGDAFYLDIHFLDGDEFLL